MTVINNIRNNHVYNLTNKVSSYDINIKPSQANVVSYEVNKVKADNSFFDKLSNILTPHNEEALESTAIKNSKPL